MVMQDGDARRLRSAAVGDRFPAPWDNERPSHLLIGGVLGGDAEQLLGGVTSSGAQKCGDCCVSHTPLPDAFGPSTLGPRPCPS
jgi:hypothetical protein